MLPLNPYTRWDYRGVFPRTVLHVVYNGTCGGNPCHVPLSYDGFCVSPALDPDGGFVPDIAPSWSDVNTDALIIAAMADISPDLDVLTTFLEGRQTIEMIVNARNDAKRLIRQARRGGFHTAKAAADAWLAWRYGWRILGYDISAIYEFIKRPYQNVIVEGRAGTSLHTSESISSTNQWNSASFETNHEVTCDASFRANVVGVYNGKTLNVTVNPLITAWELVPFSFVADWFVNIGDVLSAWQVRLSVQEMHISLGQKLLVEVNGRREAVGAGKAGDQFTGQTGAAVSHETYELKSRVPGYQPLLVPSIDVNLTWPRVLDAAAFLSKRIPT